MVGQDDLQPFWEKDAKTKEWKEERREGEKGGRGGGREGLLPWLAKKTTKETIAALRVYNGGARRIKQRLDVRMIIL